MGCQGWSFENTGGAKEEYLAWMGKITNWKTGAIAWRGIKAEWAWGAHC
jgi:hypothetical protein